MPTEVIVNDQFVSIPWDRFCDSLELLRPLLLALAWVSAAFIVLGRSGGD